MDKLQAQLPTILLNNPTVDQDRLPFFVFLRPQSFGYFNIGQSSFRLKAFQPYLEVEFWNEGEQITDFNIIKSKLKGTKWEKYLKVMQSSL